MSKEVDTFDDLVKPLIEHLAKYGNSKMKIIIDDTSAQLLINEYEVEK